MRFSAARLFFVAIGLAAPSLNAADFTVNSTADAVDQTPGDGICATAVSYLQLPLAFEVNQGQSEGRVRFLSRGRGYSLFLTPDEAVLRLHAPTRQGSSAAGRTTTGATATGHSSQSEDESRRAAVVRMRFAGANRQAEINGLDPLPGRSSYLLGNDPAKWRRDVPNYSRVRYAQVYPGIDVVFYGNERRLEFDFVVSPGADPGRIELAFDGVEKLSLDRDGNLVLATADGEIVQQKPIVYQDVNGQRKQLAGRYMLRGRLRARFQVAAYDSHRPLVIDPVLAYSTYLGSDGQFEAAQAITLDGSGNVYVTGEAYGNGFPVLGAIQPANAGIPDVFVTKLSAAGALVYSTYLGGLASDHGYAIAVDGTGAAYVAGYSTSTDFPTTAGAFQTTNAGERDAIIFKINPAGNALVYSTYLGGSGSGFSGYDVANGIAVDAGGNALIVGDTQSVGFPTTAGAYRTSLVGSQDAFLTKLNATGSALVYSTYLGGSLSDSGHAIALDGSGNAFVTGSTSSTNFPTTPGAYQTAKGAGVSADAFVTKLNLTGTGLVYSTYLGGSGSDSGAGIKVDSTGAAYVVGDTGSGNFPTVGPYQAALSGPRDVFVTKLNAAGSALVYSTYLGGGGSDYGYAIAVDGGGNAYVTGYTGSTNFPVLDPYQATRSSYDDAFVTKLNPAGNALVYSTYLGADGYDSGYAIALDAAGNAWVAGRTSSNGFPTVNPIQATKKGTNSPFDYDGFVVKFGPSATITTAVVSSLNPSTFGQSVTFTATVAGSSPTGTIQFMDGAINLGGVVTMSGGQASYTTSALAVGNHSITAVYSGDASNATSTSPVLTQVVNRVPTTTAVTSTLNPSTFGQSVTFTAIVAGSSPTGTIQFMDGATNLGTAVTMSGGQAIYPTSALTVGSHNITAVYSGDTNNAPSTSTALAQVVLATIVPAAGPTLGPFGLLILGLLLASSGVVLTLRR